MSCVMFQQIAKEVSCWFFNWLAISTEKFPAVNPVKEAGCYRKTRKGCKGFQKNQERKLWNYAEKRSFSKKTLPTSASSTEVTWEPLERVRKMSQSKCGCASQKP